MPIPRQQGHVSHAHARLLNDLAWPSLRIPYMLLHGVPHHHGRETGMMHTIKSGNYIYVIYTYVPTHVCMYYIYVYTNTHIFAYVCMCVYI